MCFTLGKNTYNFLFLDYKILSFYSIIFESRTVLNPKCSIPESGLVAKSSFEQGFSAYGFEIIIFIKPNSAPNVPEATFQS